MKYTAEQRLQAAQWFFDIYDVTEPSAELLQEWLHWLDASEGNRAAFEAVEVTYHQALTPRRRIEEAASSTESRTTASFP